MVSDNPAADQSDEEIEVCIYCGRDSAYPVCIDCIADGRAALDEAEQNSKGESK